jgi:hypothetical protein
VIKSVSNSNHVTKSFLDDTTCRIGIVDITDAIPFFGNVSMHVNDAVLTGLGLAELSGRVYADDNEI